MPDEIAIPIRTDLAEHDADGAIVVTVARFWDIALSAGWRQDTLNVLLNPLPRDPVTISGVGTFRIVREQRQN